MNKQDVVDRIKSNFPEEIQLLHQWVVWRIEYRDDKPTKVPYSVSGLRAESDNPDTWTSFDVACSAYVNGNYSGVGFMFSEYDPYTGVDFDKCVSNGEIEPEKLAHIDFLDSYTEFSQSETGAHVIVKAALPPGGRKSIKHGIEMYDNKRFFVVTGDVFGGFPRSINERQTHIEHLHAQIFPAKQAVQVSTVGHRNTQTNAVDMNDDALLKRMFGSANGAKIRSLYDGNRDGYDGDDSAADLALCNYLAFWTGNDEERINRLFKQSGLYRAKWDRNARTGETYGEGTIARAIAGTPQPYNPQHANGNGSNGHSAVNGLNGTTPEQTETTEGEPMGKSKKSKKNTLPSVSPIKTDNALLSQGAHDEGNAQCVNIRHAGKFVQNDAFGWMHFTGTHWTAESGEETLDRAIVDTLSARIDAALHSGKADYYKDLITKSIPSADKVRGAKYLFKSLATIPTSKFDVDPDLLNCKNGVIDLRTGEVKPHNPAEYFTHCIDFAYRPDADYSAWVTWLTDAVGNNPNIAAWLQMAVGYSLTGHTREEVLFYLYGQPRSGKGTFTETLLALLGKPLSAEVDFGTFTSIRTGDSQNFDLAPLKPCRIIMASESNSYERFNAAKVKALTGGNDIYCAHKHRSHFNYKPLFKIWLSSNHPVNADPDDDAVWGRVRVVEFPNSHLGSEDKSLKIGMRAPAMLEAVLAWAIEGAMKWYALGSAGLPELVSSQNIKADQRQSLDNVQGWLDECCIVGGDGFTANSFLYLSYERWCKENGVDAKKQKGFSQALIRKGYQSASTMKDGKALRGFRGIGL